MAPGLLMIGDSQLKYVLEYSHLFPAFEITVMSRSGMKVEEVDEDMLEVSTFFNNVVIHVGTNNLICGQTPEETFQQVIVLVNKIFSRNPGVNLVVSSVLERSVSLFKSCSPYAEWRIKEMNEKIQKLNSLLKGLADSSRKLGFVNNWLSFQALSWNPHKEMLSRDGLHLSPRGVKCLIGIPNSCGTTSKHQERARRHVSI